MSSVVHHNPYINVLVVNLLMQELFADKIHFFKFLCTCDKPWLHRRKTITALIPISCYKILEVCGYQEGEIPCARTNAKPQQLFKYTKISYSIASLVFCKFACHAYGNGINWGTSKLRHSKTSKSMDRVSLITFVGNPDFSILVHRVQYFKNLFLSRR